MVVYVVDHSTSEKHEFDVAGDTTVWKLKGLIEEKTNHSNVDQVLTYRGIRVEPLMNATLAESGIADGKTVDLWLRDSAILLDIKTLPHERYNLNGQTICIAVKRGALVEDIKAAIQEGRGVPPDEQRLIFAGQQLEDARSIESYGIQSGSVLYLVLRMWG